MSTISNIPEVIIIGFHGKSELEIIEGIISEPLTVQESSEHIEKYKWLIDNKYYSAEINLCKLKDKYTNSISPSIFEFAEAIIFYIDNEKTSVLNDVDEVLKNINNLDFDVKLLVCDGFASKGEEDLTRNKALEWSINHGWELVELNLETTEIKDEDDLEDDFNDSWGYTRIKQALNAHTWSNLQLKDKENACMAQLVKKLTLTDSKQVEVPYKKLETGETCDDDFSELFSSLGAMKEKADALPTKERRLYAEKIAFAFLRSMGDDEDLYTDEE